MKFCPDSECPASHAGEAARQNHADLENCSTCGTALVATLDFAPEPDDEMGIVDRFPISHEAHMARALLESERIPATVQQDDGQFVSVGMGSAVMVPESYLDIAQQVLQRGPAGLPEEFEQEEPEDETTEQAARMRKIGRAARYVAFLAIMFAVLGTFFGFANLTHVNNLRTGLDSLPDEVQVPAFLLSDGNVEMLLDPETGELRSVGEVRRSLRLYSVTGFLGNYILAFTFAGV